jgi:hypothetical protein
MQGNQFRAWRWSLENYRKTRSGGARQPNNFHTNTQNKWAIKKFV